MQLTNQIKKGRDWSNMDVKRMLLVILPVF